MQWFVYFHSSPEGTHLTLFYAFVFVSIGTRAETHPLRCTYLEHRDGRGASFGADWGHSTQPSQHKDAPQMSGRVAPQVPADRSAEKDLPQNHSAKVRKC